MSPMESILPLCGAAAILVGPLWYGRAAGGRRAARVLYRSGAFPFYLRAGPAVAPLGAFGLLVVQLALLAPPEIHGWIASLGAGIIAAAAALGYRRPPPLAPRWMRDELAAGTLPTPVWDWLDRLQCGVLVVGAAVGVLGFLIGFPR